MKTTINIFLTIGALLLISAFAHAQDAKQIVTKAEDNIRGLSSVVDMTIQVKRPTWSRTMTVKAWSKE